MFDFLRKLLAFFKDNNIDYMLSGSVAMSLYTEPRFTRDYDFIVHLDQKDIESLLQNFNEGYYCEEESIKEAVKGKGMFNIIDHASGYKADFVLLKNEPFRQMEFSRRQKVPFLDMELYIVSVEDLLLSKLIWIQELQSGVQQEDIKKISALPALDWEYITNWVKQLRLKTYNLLPV